MAATTKQLLPREVLTGVLERITFQNPESHFTIAKLRRDDERRGGVATIVGMLVAVEVGESLRCEGRWEESREWGPQFRVETYTALTPATAYGIERYLGSGLVKGVGPALAKRIVEKFGDKTLAVL